MKFALLGRPGVGKKTFFSLLTARSPHDIEIPATLYGLMRRKNVRREGELLVAAAPIRDERLSTLSGLLKPKRTTRAENNVVLCPDMTEGADRKWLEPARRSDLLCVILRGFRMDGEDLVPSESVDREKSGIESDLLLADLELMENRLINLNKEIRGSRSARQEYERDSLLKVKERLENEMRLSLSVSQNEIEPISSLGLLSLKPIIWTRNVDEVALGSGAEAEHGEFLVSCKVEQEISAISDPAEQAVYLREMGVKESGLDRLNAAAYDALGLMSFYTVGSDEVRAWSVKKGTLAPEAAGKIHSDFQRGFIRVEVIKYRDFVSAGSEAAAKAAGMVHTRGKDYIIEDGDICHFLFNI